MNEDIPIVPTFLPPEDITGQFIEVETPPNRTYEQALVEDGLATIRKVAEIYTPNFSESDLDGLKEAYEFWMDNPTVLEDLLLPDYVIKHYEKIAGLFIAGEFKCDPEATVTYSSDSEDWEKLLRALTLDEFDRLRQYPFEGKVFDRESVSTTAKLYYIYKLYHGQVEGEDRDKAIDLLVGTLINAYYRRLARATLAQSY